MRDTAWGEGAFAKRDIAKGELVAMYGGYVLTPQQHADLKAQEQTELAQMIKSGNYTDHEVEDVSEGHFTYR